MVDFSYDLVIKDGYVVDGTGRPRIKANVYVEDDRITRVASDGPRSGDRVIDAEGMIVSPGFVDMHSHSDFTIFGNRKADSLIHQGATTLYFTPDGWSPAPVDREHRKELEEYLVDEGMPANMVTNRPRTKANEPICRNVFMVCSIH